MKRLHTLGLSAAFLVEFALFHATTTRRYTWLYPRWWDQLQYLTEAYQGYEYRREHGFLAAVAHALGNRSPQGTLHTFWTLLIFSVAGPSRLAALTVNLLAFLALQAATFLTVRRLSRSYALAWGSVALLAALRCPWSGESASVIDFRLDWMAACAYGIALSAAIAGNGFRSTRWALAFGGAVGLVLLTRSLTAVYFVVIFPVLLGALLTRPDRWTRCGRLALSGLVALAMAGPVFWHKRQALHDYYWIGHIVGPERELRDSHLSAAASIRLLFSELFFTQLGGAVAILWLGAASALIACRLFSLTREVAAPALSSSTRSAWAAAMVFFAAPAVVLSEHPLKAPQPISILLAGSVWLAILTWLHLSRKVRPEAVALVSGAVVLAGAVIFAAAITRPTYSREMAQQARELNALADYLYFRAEESGLTEPRVGETLLSDGFNSAVFSILGYERHHHWLQFEDAIGQSLFARPREAILQELGQCDFVCLLTGAEPPSWPYDRQMAQLSPVLQQWCQDHLRHEGDLIADGFFASIYDCADLGRPGGGSAVALAPLLSRAMEAADLAVNGPPAAPLFLSSSVLVWSVNETCSYSISAAYSPVCYSATGLPEGFSLDERTGELRGRPSQPGVFTVKITATNSAGSAVQDLNLRVESQAFLGEVRAPLTGAVGQAVYIDYAAFDAGGKLDFIDVVDLTAGKALDRLVTGGGLAKNWQGRYRLTFSQPGRHTLTFRFMRFDPAEKSPYGYCDRVCEIEVTPR